MKYNLEKLLKENMNIHETPSEELQKKILQQEREVMTMHKKTKIYKLVPKIAVAALATVCTIGGIAYAGTNLWNHYVAENFGVEKNDTLKKDLVDKGFAGQPQATKSNNGQLSVTDKDITVTVQQTLADEQSAYVCFEVKYGDKYHVVDKGTTEISDFGVARPEWTDFQMASGMELNYSGGISKIKDDHTILYGYFLTTSDANDSFKDGKIKMSISAFEMDKKKCDDNPEIIAKDGKWDLTWNLSVGTEKRVYHIDKKLTLGKNHVVVKELEISPLSAKVKVECPDGVSLSEIWGIVKDTGDKPIETDKNGNMIVLRYIHAGSNQKSVDKMMKALPKGEILLSFDSFQIYLENGEFDGMGGMGYTENKNIFSQFDKILDMDKITGIQVAGKYIDLKSISYETVR